MDKQNWNEQQKIKLKPHEYEKIKNAIMAGIADCIFAHGPIQKKDIASATKRVYGQLKAVIRDL